MALLMIYITIILHIYYTERRQLQYLTTPEHCFEQITDFPYAAHFLQVDDNEGSSLKLHWQVGQL